MEAPRKPFRFRPDATTGSDVLSTRLIGIASGHFIAMACETNEDFKLGKGRLDDQVHQCD